MAAQIEKLKDREGLQSTIRSESLYSYNEKRSGYVERPDDSNQWMQLSRALKDFDQPLAELMEARRKKLIEKGIAEGQAKFDSAEADPTTNNKLAWAKMVEQNPELAGINPWVEKGYEAARLRSLGLDFKTQLQQAYAENGLMNEKDQVKVAKFVDQFEKDFREANGLNAYEDKVALGEHFGRLAVESRAAIFNQFTNDFARENLKQAVLGYKQLISKEIDGIIENPAVNFSDPHARETVVVPQIQEAVTRIAQQAALHGVPASEVPGMVFEALSAEAVERGYKDGGDDLLEIAKNLDFGQGKLGDVPGYKDWIAKTEQQFINQEKQDKREEEYEREKREREYEKSATDLAVSAAIDGTYMTAEQLRAKGIPARMIPGVLGKINSIQGAREIKESYANWSPTKQQEFTMLQLRADRGELTQGELLNAVAMYGREGQTLVSLYMKTERQADTMTASSINSAQTQAFRLVSGVKDGDLDSLTLDQMEMPHIQRGLEAAREVSFLLQQKVEKEYGTGDGAQKPSATKLQFLEMEAVEEVLRKDKYKIYAGEGGPQATVGGSTTTTAATISQQQQADAQAISFVEEADKKNLFGFQSIPEWEAAYQEFVDSPNPMETTLGKQIAPLKLNEVQLDQLLAGQQAYYDRVRQMHQSYEKKPGPLDRLYQTFVVEDKADFGAFKRAYNRLTQE